MSRDARLACALVTGVLFGVFGWLSVAGPPGPTTYEGPAFPPLWSVAAGDLDGDGADDFAIGGRGPDNHFVTPFLRVPETSLAFLRGASLPADSAFLGRLAFGDVDGDGRLDVVAGHGREIAVFFRNADGAYEQGLVASGRTNRRLTVADVDQDGRAEVVLITTGGLHMLEADGSSPRMLASRRVTDGEFTAVAVGDLDGDDRPDLAVSRLRPAPRAIAVLRQDSGGGFTQIAEIPLRRWAKAIAIGTLDAGLRNAIVFVRGRQLWIAHGDSGGAVWQSEVLLSSRGGGRYSWLAVRDMDGDGAADLVVKRGRKDAYSPEAIVLLRQDPLSPGQFLDVVYGKTPVSEEAALGDFDGDALADIVVSSKPPSVILQDPAAPGRFLPARRIQIVQGQE